MTNQPQHHGPADPATPRPAHPSDEQAPVTGTHYPAGSYEAGGNEARKYQPAHGERWSFPTPAGTSDTYGTPPAGEAGYLAGDATGRPGPRHAQARGPRSRNAAWALCILSVALLVASVVWLGLTTSQIPTPTMEERHAREAVQTPDGQAAPNAPGGEHGEPGEHGAGGAAPDDPNADNEIRVPSFALWAPGTRIQSTDHKPEAGESFTAQSCTVALSFSDAAGDNFAVTAGHCGRVGDFVWPTNATQAIDYAREVGHFVYSGLYSHDGTDAAGVDVGIIKITDPERYMEVIGDPIPTGIAERVPSIERVCKTGSTTGYTCGEFEDTQRVQIVNAGSDENRETFGDIASVCAAAGDSGGPVFTEVNGRAVIIGVVSGTEAGRSDEDCWEGMENPKLMSYSNVEQMMTVIDQVVPNAQWQFQTW